MKKLLTVLALAVVLVLGYGVYAAIRAHSKLVTLNVRNADVRDVIRKVEWQMWEKIFVDKNVSGKITLNIHRVPLAQALDLIGEQASCRWSTVYPLYSSRKSLTAFKQAALGEINPSENGWTNFNARGFAGRMGGGFGNNLRSQNAPISLDLKNKEFDVAVMALARHASGRIIAEDGDYSSVWLSLDRATVPDAVAKLAKQIHRKWTSYYVLQSRRGGPPGNESLADGGTNQNSEASEDARIARQQRFESLLETMTPEEREKAEAARERREAFQQMTPEQRQQASDQRAADPQVQQRMQDRMLAGLLNSTPEERVERTQLRLQRAAQRAR